MTDRCPRCQRRTYPTEEAAGQVAERNAVRYVRPHWARECPSGVGWHVATRVPAGTRLLTRVEVARMFAVTEKTVRVWAHNDELAEIRTLGRHARYLLDEVRALMAIGEQQRGQAA